MALGTFMVNGLVRVWEYIEDEVIEARASHSVSFLTAAAVSGNKVTTSINEAISQSFADTRGP